MTNKPKFKVDDRVTYIGGLGKREAKVHMVNSAVPGDGYSYDIVLAGEVYTVAEKYLRPIMSDARLAREIAHEYAQAQYHIDEARKALMKAQTKVEQDGQPDYEVDMVREFVIILKNTLRFELTNQINHWDGVALARKEKY